MRGYIHRLESLGTLDGPGVRAVVFASGCPLRCAYCHNPDTQKMSEEATESDELREKILRLYPYIKDGGVTFSGGEPLMQSEFFATLATDLRERGLHIALDTSGCIINEGVRALLSLCDLVLLDIKFTSEKDYKTHTGGTLSSVMEFLALLHELKIKTVIRHVVVPSLNDNKEDLDRLYGLISPYLDIIEGVELLPFKKLCLEKYEALGREFPLRDTPEMDVEKNKSLQDYINGLLK